MAISEEAKELARQHRMAFISFHAAYKELREQHGLSEDEAVDLLFPPMDEVE